MTPFIKKKDIKKDWYIIDAQNASVGRLASYISMVLRGKNKSKFNPNQDNGDFVVVKNIEKIKFTGKKFKDKKTKQWKTLNESVTIGESNYLTSPRAIYSKVNEDDRLDNFEGNKSMQMRLTLGTTDPRLSPVLDAQRVSTILTSNRVNDVVSNYATDDRVKTLDNDPTGCQYITKEISIENAATSIKILLAGHIHADADIRAFYAIGNRTGFEPIFTPFPGFENLNSRGKVININK